LQYFEDYNENYRSGFIAIMGSPNVGKSTLMNALLGTKVAIVSDKAQTTRNKVVGVLTKSEYQIVFLDTPGLHSPKNRLGEYMVKTAYDAARDVDAVLMVIDAKMGIRRRDEGIIEQLKGENFIAAINKADIVSDEKVDAAYAKLTEMGVPARRIHIISAKEKIGLSELEEALAGMLPPGPQFYPDDMLTDRPERFIAGEMIREKAMLNLRDEVPHGVGVEIEKVEELDTITNVAAVIYCERAGHKGIIIGKKGNMLKKIGSEARADLEMLFGTKVFLELWVKVKPDWRNSAHMLKTLGYRD